MFDSLPRDKDYIVEDSGVVFYDWYNTGTKNGNDVDQGRPQITVLTHGLGGNAGHWSNNGEGNFAENENSIIDAFSANNAKVTAIITHYSERDNKENAQVTLDFGKDGEFDVFLPDNDHDGEFIKTTTELSFDMAVNTCIKIKERA